MYSCISYISQNCLVSSSGKKTKCYWAYKIMLLSFLNIRTPQGGRLVVIKDQKSNPNLARSPKLICRHPTIELPQAVQQLTSVMGRIQHAWYVCYQSTRKNAQRCSFPIAVQACVAPAKWDNLSPKLVPHLLQRHVEENVNHIFTSQKRPHNCLYKYNKKPIKLSISSFVQRFGSFFFSLVSHAMWAIFQEETKRQMGKPKDSFFHSPLVSWTWKKDGKKSQHEKGGVLPPYLFQLKKQGRLHMQNMTC